MLQLVIVHFMYIAESAQCWYTQIMVKSFIKYHSTYSLLSGPKRFRTSFL